MVETNDSHPNDVVLLEFVEGELGGSEADAIRAHLAVCAECAAEVAAAESARDTLRETPLLRLPEGRLEEMTASLGAQETRSSGQPRSLFGSRRRFLPILIPAGAALAAVVIAFAVTGGGTDADQQAGDAALAQTEAAEAGAAESAPDTATEAVPAPVVSVQGPPRAVVRILRQAGFTARRSEGTVIVVGARPAAVRAALADRPRGNVSVVVVPP